MAFELKNKYWKIVDIKVDRQLKKANVTLVGFLNEEDSKKPKLAQFIPGYPKHQFELKDKNYPFVNNADPNMIALTYEKIKELDKFFKDAKSV